MERSPGRSPLATVDSPFRLNRHKSGFQQNITGSRFRYNVGQNCEENTRCRLRLYRLFEPQCQAHGP